MAINVHLHHMPILLPKQLNNDVKLYPVKYSFLLFDILLYTLYKHQHILCIQCDVPYVLNILKYTNYKH